jgi:DNA-binding transcriptional ArsR family regulator
LGVARKDHVPVSHHADDSISPRLLKETAVMLAALSTPVRLHIVWLLAGGDRDVGTLPEETGQTAATVSQHLGRLKLAGFVGVRRQGRRHLYIASNAGVVEAARPGIDRWLHQQPAAPRLTDAPGSQVNVCRTV